MFLLSKRVDDNKQGNFTSGDANLTKLILACKQQDWSRTLARPDLSGKRHVSWVKEKCVVSAFAGLSVYQEVEYSRVQ